MKRAPIEPSLRVPDDVLDCTRDSSPFRVRITASRRSFLAKPSRTRSCLDLGWRLAQLRGAFHRNEFLDYSAIGNSREIAGRSPDIRSAINLSSERDDFIPHLGASIFETSSLWTLDGGDLRVAVQTFAVMRSRLPPRWLAVRARKFSCARNLLPAIESIFLRRC